MALLSVRRTPDLTALGHGCDTLLEVVGLAEAILFGLLAIGGDADPLGEVASHGLTDRVDGEGGGGRDLGGQLRWPSLRSSSRGTRRSHRPMFEGFFSFDPTAGVEHLESLLLADDVGQCDGEAEAVMEAEAREVGREPSFRGRRL